MMASADYCRIRVIKKSNQPRSSEQVGDLIFSQVIKLAFIVDVHQVYLKFIRGQKVITLAPPDLPFPFEEMANRIL